MCDAPHARFRDRLTLLSTDALLTRAITELGSPRGWWADLAWSRMSGRFKPHAAAFGEFLFEHHGPPQSICRVEAFDTRPAPADIDAPCARTAAGWLRVTRFPSDAALPALPSVLAAPGRATVVRYHPRHRCTIRFEQDERTLFAKVYAVNRGERLHRAGLTLWEAASRGQLELGVAGVRQRNVGDEVRGRVALRRLGALAVPARVRRDEAEPASDRVGEEGPVAPVVADAVEQQRGRLGTGPLPDAETVDERRRRYHALADRLEELADRLHRAPTSKSGEMGIAGHEHVGPAAPEATQMLIVGIGAQAIIVGCRVRASRTLANDERDEPV